MTLCRLEVFPWTWLWLALATGGALASASAAAPNENGGRAEQAAAAEERNFRVMTFNIRYAEPGDGTNRWEKRREAVAALIAAECDLAGLQEALADQVADLRARLPEFDAVSRGREIDPAEGEACPVFYRRERFERVATGTFWLSETPATPGSRDWGNTLPRICTWMELRDKRYGGSLRVFNVHLDNLAEKSRRRGLALVRRLAEAVSGPVIVLGDCNESPEGPAVVAMTRGGAWRDAWREQGGSGADGGTFNGWRPAGPYGRIDYVFYREAELRALACRVLAARVTPGGGWVSDHFPVVATLAGESGLTEDGRKKAQNAQKSQTGMKSGKS